MLAAHNCLEVAQGMKLKRAGVGLIGCKRVLERFLYLNHTI